MTRDMPLLMPTLPNESAESTRASKFKRTKKFLIILCLLIVIILAIVFRKDVIELFESYLSWMRDAGVLGPLTYIGVYIVATVCFLPGSILTLGAGFIFNEIWGFVGILIAIVVVFIGASIGALIAFLLGRTAFREFVLNYAKKSPKFMIIDRVIGDEGLKLIFLLRLSPLLPFNVSNYVYGVTAVSLRNYILACFGLLPGIIAFVIIGSSLSNISAASSGIGGNTVALIFIIVGSILALAVSIYVSFVAKREIDKIVKDNDDTIRVEAASREREINELEWEEVEQV